MQFQQYEIDSYLLARHEAFYLKEGSFDRHIMQYVNSVSSDCRGAALSFLEKMVSHSSEFERMEREHLPILIYLPDGLCCGVLRNFAIQMKTSLEELGEIVELFDLQDFEPEKILLLKGLKYKAILGFQSYVFSIELKDGRNFHDLIDGPKFNMQFDHPLNMHNHYVKAPRDFYVLTHDRNYQRYVKKYYPEIADCYYLMPAGTKWQGEDSQKKYPLSFVGSFHNWKRWIPQVQLANRQYKGLANKVMRYMRHHLNSAYEAALEEVLKEEGLIYTDSQFRKAAFDLKETYFILMSYCRERIIRKLLEEGITLHVFGDSWQTLELSKSEELIIHPETDASKTGQIYAESEMTLNIMSWHKDGMTERIADAMQNGAAAVSDRSTYLEEAFEDGTDIVLFDLEQTDLLPARIKELLEDSERRTAIARRGREKALKEHTWRCRAERLEELIRGEV